MEVKMEVKVDDTNLLSYLTPYLNISTYKHINI